MNFTDFQEFFLEFYQLVVFLGLALMIVASMMLAVLTIVRAAEEA